MDISVPARTEGRTTRHTETWTIARLLATLAAYHRDKPDIALTSGGLEIGIEITEAISTQYAAYQALETDLHRRSKQQFEMAAGPRNH
jgi:hypothetical protein